MAGLRFRVRNGCTMSEEISRGPLDDIHSAAAQSWNWKAA